ncbi:MAG: AAA family ATPase [Syntrophobacteraceae bacterium]
MIRDYLTAGYPALYFVTQEPHRAEEVLAKQAEGKCAPYAWDCLRGIRKAGSLKVEETVYDPTDAMRWLNDREDTILFMHNLHLFMAEIPEVKQAIQNGVQYWKSKGSCLCVVAPEIKLTIEVEKFFFVLDFPLPDEDRLAQIQTELSQTDGVYVETSPAATLAAKGLTEFEAETAFSFSLATKGVFDPRVVSRAKAQMIKKSGFLEFWEPGDPKDVGGLGGFKDWFAPRLESYLPGSIKPPPRAVLFVGVPGTGKSLTAKAMAAMIGWDLIRFDITATKDSLVGRSERNMRQAMSIIDGFGRAVVWIDEIEKALGGAGAANKTGDVTGNQLGILLTWMQETKSQILVAATANRVDILPPELLRRFDEIFYVDAPVLAERLEIIPIMNRRFNTEIPLEMAGLMEGWTGAEIEKLARASLFEPVESAVKCIVPITKTSKEVVEALRAWAANRARPANSPNEEVLEGRKLKL